MNQLISILKATNQNQHNKQWDHFIFRFRDIKAFLHTQNAVRAERRYRSNRVYHKSHEIPSNMKLYLIVCYVAAAILVAQAYKSEDLNAWYEEAKEALEMMEDQGELQNLEDKGNSSQPGPTPTGNPHGCDCKGECKKLHHSRVPYKEEVTLWPYPNPPKHTL